MPRSAEQCREVTRSVEVIWPGTAAAASLSTPQAAVCGLGGRSGCSGGGSGGPPLVRSFEHGHPAGSLVGQYGHPAGVADGPCWPLKFRAVGAHVFFP